jgi:uncharacterized membrane protein
MLPSGSPRPRRRLVKTVLRYVMAAFYVFGGVNHFVRPDFYLSLMPPYLPLHAEMVALTGVIEIVLGVMVAIPRTASLAAWGIILMLIAFLPVHVHMLVNNHLYPEAPTSVLWLRFPIQALFILWAYWYTEPRRPRLEAGASASNAGAPNPSV